MLSVAAKEVNRYFDIYVSVSADPDPSESLRKTERDFDRSLNDFDTPMYNRWRTDRRFRTVFLSPKVKQGSDGDSEVQAMQAVKCACLAAEWEETSFGYREQHDIYSLSAVPKDDAVPCAFILRNVKDVERMKSTIVTDTFLKKTKVVVIVNTNDKVTADIVNAIRTLKGPDKLAIVSGGTLTAAALEKIVNTGSDMKMLLTNFTEAVDLGFIAKLRGLESVSFFNSKLQSDFRTVSQLKKLSALDLSCTKVTDECFEGLQHCKLLETLNLSGCNSLKNMEILASFLKIKEVNFKMCSVESLGEYSIGQWPRLERIDLSGCKKLQQLNSIWSSPCLEYVNLSGTLITTLGTNNKPLETLKSIGISGCVNLDDFAVLMSCKNLERVDLSGISIQPLIEGGAVNWPNLEAIGLSKCADLKNLSVLAGCTKLKELWLDGTSIKSLEDIKDNQWLKVLDMISLADCKELTDVSALSGCPKLRSILLNRCGKLEDVSPLARCPNLEVLLVCQTGIKNLGTYLEGAFRNLKIVEASNCAELRDISGLGACKSLESLRLLHTKIKTLGDSSSVAWGKLKLLHVNGCAELSDISALQSCPEVEEVFLCGTACERVDHSVAIRLEKLQSINLSHCEKLVDVSALGSCPKLKKLDLSCTPITSLLRDSSFVSEMIDYVESLLPIVSPAAGLWRSLEVLVMRGCWCISNMEVLASFPKLKEVDFFKSSVESLGRYRLGKWPSLERINCSGCDSLEDMGSIWSSPCLEYVNLSGTAIATLGDPRYKPKATLKSLNICMCRNLGQPKEFRNKYEDYFSNTTPDLKIIPPVMDPRMGLDISGCVKLGQPDEFKKEYKDYFSNTTPDLKITPTDMDPRKCAE